MTGWVHQQRCDSPGRIAPPRRVVRHLDEEPIVRPASGDRWMLPVAEYPGTPERVQSVLRARFAAVAAEQHGAVARGQLRDLGLTGRQIDRLVTSGRLEAAGPGTYRVPGSAATWLQRVQIALLAAGPDAVASHRSAAALLGLDGFRTGPVEITVDRRHRNRLVEVADVALHSTVRLQPIDRAMVGTIATTSAVRTVIDLAACGATATEVGNAIDSAARLGLATAEFVQRRLSSLGRRGRPGVGLIDAVMLDAGGHSFLERRFLQLMRVAGLPRPRTQVVHRAGTAVVARVDFEWTGRWLVAEVNGRRGHVTESDRSKDARRRNELQHRGYTVLEFTTPQVLDDPDYVVASVAIGLSGEPLASNDHR